MTSGELYEDFPSTPDQARQLNDIILPAIERGVLRDFESMTVEASAIPDVILRRFTNDYVFTYDPDDLEACSTEGTLDNIEEVQLNRQLLGRQPLQIYRQPDMTTEYRVEVCAYVDDAEITDPHHKSLIEAIVGTPEESQYDMVASIRFERWDMVEGLLAQVRQIVKYETWSHQQGGAYIEVDSDADPDYKTEVHLTPEGRLVRDAQQVAQAREMQTKRGINDLERVANGEPTFKEVFEKMRESMKDELLAMETVPEEHRYSDMTLDEIITEARLDGQGVITVKEAAAVITFAQHLAEHPPIC